MRLVDVIPTADELLALTAEELAGAVLRVLITQNPEERGVSRHQFSLAYSFVGFEPDKIPACQHAVMETWIVLLREGLIAPKPGPEGWYFVTRRGMSAKSSQDYEVLRHAWSFPKDTIHPKLKHVYSQFSRGDYETAVFQAFKSIEVAVREACPSLDQRLIGVDLMRKAFHPETGPLRSESEHGAEREALAALFAGAIGRFKNPTSHRHVPMDSPAEAVEIIQFASNLMRVVEDRASAIKVAEGKIACS